MRGSWQLDSLEKLHHHPMEEELVLSPYQSWVNPHHQVGTAVLLYFFCLGHVGDIAAGMWEGTGDRRKELKSESLSFP